MRIKTAHIALFLSVIALAVSLFNGVQISRGSDEALIQALMAQNAALQAQIDALTSQADSDPEAVPTLTAVPWADGTGADVTLMVETDAESALLRVMVGGEFLTEAPCRRSGSLLTATVQVPSGNGYTYSMVIGSEATTLASPANPVYPELVFLADALSAYCNLVVGEWFVGDDALTLNTCYAQVQTPLLRDAPLTCDQVDLALKIGHEVVSRVDVTVFLTENGAALDGQITGVVLPLPALEDGQEVELWLEARLSDGRILDCCAATWYAMHGGFSMAAG